MRLEVPADLAGERVDKVVAVAGDVSRAVARALVEAGGVTCDDRVVAPTHRVAEGEVVSFEPPEPAPVLEPEHVNFEVVFEDQHLLVVDKPPGVVTHPGGGRRSGTLASGLLHRYPDLEGVGEPGRWGIVHRLDRETSGLLLVARTAESHRTLSRALKRRNVHRTYLALIEGTLDLPRGTIEAPISSDPRRPTRRAVSAEGRPAVTHYRKLRDWPVAGVTLLEVTLETGRTHQIRVHLASIDHPVVGDRTYGRPGRVSSPRVFLHAAKLGFTHPVTGEEIEVESPLPDDLAAVIADLEASC